VVAGNPAGAMRGKSADRGEFQFYKRQACRILDNTDFH
jgi:hypothetical protein